MSALYIGATGMKTHSAGMQVTGNNIANVNTTAYKNSQIRYEDLMSSSVASAATSTTVGMAQTGHGSSVQDVVTMYTQGSFQTTSSETDVAISGKGFFAVRNMEDDSTYYTRAGNFVFDKDGFLVDTNGYAVRGVAYNTDGTLSDVTTDVRLWTDANEVPTLAAKSTAAVTLASNLDRSVMGDTSAPTLASMLANYDGTSATEPLSADEYSYADTVTVYDSSGEKHTLSVYYSKVGQDEQTGDTIYGYIAAVPGAEDGSALAGTSAAGMLMSGTLTFSSDGVLTSQTAYTYSGAGDPTDLSTWSLATLSTDAAPSMTATFSNGATMTTSLNFGLSSTTGTWTGDSTLADAASGSVLSSFDATRSASSSTAYSGTSYNSFQDQDGYPEGSLTRVSFAADGTLVGDYSNGETADLYRLRLYDFTNEYGLTHEGGNLYSANNTTGEIVEGFAGEGMFGSVSGSTLELSNVDLASEFVTMITTQRGFQANSKIITTTDSLLQTAINLKR
ncbi:putative flagellar hook-basal body protein [Megalodesulfovibrio gigas DSM 1382 = ATCC 19364]|uniref:Flagellar hook protein FlgE n=2 Tax=Megalodesulfovibrio gigas TaxID=879 RepID=T2GC12_MEGG1|nr:putative flagellar hook-basal body protein [Megalodesulfovibrio gigas DSM 1382 = ATCC 19364]